jgi:hypothetical protein
VEVTERLQQADRQGHSVVGARPKTVYVRSEAYRRFCASLPCLVCGIEGQTQAAHPNSAKYGKGRSIKAGDQYVFPLCIRHHAEHDMCYEMTKAERDAIEDEHVARMQAIAADAGWADGRRSK